MSLLHKIPLSELPRERLLRDGVESLSQQELIAILLGTGTRGKSVLVLAQELLIYFGGMEGLLNASVTELQQIKGIGLAKAILLKAAFSLAKRAAKEKILPHEKITKISQAVDLAKGEIGHLKKEALLIILRDVKGRKIHHEVISLGTLSEVLVHPREVFQPAIRHGAHSIILCHNHPSGDPSPSQNDIDLTRKLTACAQLMGIFITDHLIIGFEDFVSMRELKYIH